MGALANAVSLMNDPTWRQWLTASAVYNARLVYLEADTVPDHAIRLRLAMDVLVAPETITQRLVTIISTDPDVASLGGTPALVGEQLTTTKVGDVWTRLAHWQYPQET